MYQILVCEGETGEISPQDRRGHAHMLAETRKGTELRTAPYP